MLSGEGRLVIPTELWFKGQHSIPNTMGVALRQFFKYFYCLLEERVRAHIYYLLPRLSKQVFAFSASSHWAFGWKREPFCDKKAGSWPVPPHAGASSSHFGTGTFFLST